MDDNRYYFNIRDILIEFPFYLISISESKEIFFERTLNRDFKIANEIAEILGLTLIPEQATEGNVCFANSTELRNDYKASFTSADVLNYCYAFFHSSANLKNRNEHLNVSLLKVPYPKVVETFWQFSNFGKELRQIHMLKDLKTDEFDVSYPKAGSNKVTRELTKARIGFEITNENCNTGKVWINDEQYFDKVPKVAWEFYLGGYHPAQKWLNDRKLQELKSQDILYYQKIIVALTATVSLMKQIDKI